MKINELRVKNWVYCDKGIHNIVEGIRLSGDVFNNEIEIHSKDGVKSTVNVNKLSPIPLTENILLKCGFHKSGDNLMFGKIYIKSLGSCITVSDDYFAFRIYTVSVDHPTFVRDIDYVHELQNLYFTIANDELDITL